MYFLGITKEQHDKLKDQQRAYLDARDKLEAQLLKLKEQREGLKEDGHVHDDQIMKENAKLQVRFSPNLFSNPIDQFQNCRKKSNRAFNTSMKSLLKWKRH